MQDPTSTALHAAVESGDVERVRTALAGADARAALSAPDAEGCTPLVRAVIQGSLPIVALLLEAGSDPNVIAAQPFGLPRTVLACAVSAGDPAIVAALLDAGADLGYSREGFGAVLDAAYGRDVLADQRLTPLLALLIEGGARLNDISPYQESALRTFSRTGRFDAVAQLLAAGADEAQLAWTPLHRAVAIGTLDEVRRALDDGADLEARDWWSRTSWHVALLSADLDRATLLRERGADTAATGRCGMPSLFYAIHSRSPECVRYVLEMRPPLEQTDQFGGTALMEAAELGDSAAVDLLLAAGAWVDFEKVWRQVDSAELPPSMTEALARAGGQTALEQTEDAVVARRLLDAGADPQHLTFGARRALVGLPAEPTMRAFDGTPEQYRAGRERRFGTNNPDRMDVPHWLAMIRSGVDAFLADKQFAPHNAYRSTPGWCARRYGQSLTFLPDGRIVQVAGEHEDSYDPDFCIYNDVFVHAPDGTIAIYGYPPDVFPPTDFHTATLIGDTLWLIGSLAYIDARRPAATPVYALDTRTFRIEPIATSGAAPGWIHRHRAVRRGADEIVVSGGSRATEGGGFQPLEGEFVLNVRTGAWD